MISESDWKKYKALRAKAVERFAQRVLDESLAICHNDSKTPHQRYLDLYDLVRKRDQEIARIFDDLRRSTAIMCLISMHNTGLITQEELSEFSAEVRQVTGLE